MTFERLVRDEKFASEVTTTAVGRLGLNRPTMVVTVDAHVNADRTAALLTKAHERATADGAATLIHGLAVPFAGFEGSAATEVKPDFAVIAPDPDREGQSWLVVGDAKDYERVRSRIEDTRLLKGFLQVALGAESAEAWSRLPDGMTVHSHGVLAVPRNSFLQPEALVELLDDHREEVRMRVAERRREAAESPYPEGMDIARFVAHLRATFDPATCPTCPLFSFCRNELRTSSDPADLLIELGIPADVRPQVLGLVHGNPELGKAPASVAAQVMATIEGAGHPTGQRRTDQAGQIGTVNVVVVKSDAAALGIHGIALQCHTELGREPWQITVFDDPQSAQTRREVMALLGHALTRTSNEDAHRAAHLVVSDATTSDILVSIADNLAGIELSRLRWERDQHMDRPPLTYNGEPAQVPAPLHNVERLAVSFLLEEDRARAFKLRSPIVNAGAVLAQHVVAGGPAIAAKRLDYLVAWAESMTNSPVKPRELEDEIEASRHSPGARMTNHQSDAVHRALSGTRGSGKTRGTPPDPNLYTTLVTDELTYKGDILERALDALNTFSDSRLRAVHRAIEADAQAVWRRRLVLHASDLVRFGRTYRHWRNSLVPVIESDGLCERQLAAMANPQAAADLAADAGVRDVATATVVSAHPLVLEIDSRRIGAGARIALLHVNGDACVERPEVELTLQAGSFKFGGLAIGPLASAEDDLNPRRVEWTPANIPALAAGDRLVIANFAWFCDNKGNKFLNVKRPKADEVSAPKATCTPESYTDANEAHLFCCRPHEDAEADWSDQLAERRTRGELNPQAWPPVVDGDAFEVTPIGALTGDATTGPATTPPDGMTMDDVE